MTSLLRHLKGIERIEQASAKAHPSYDAYRIQSALLVYVVGESHHDETVSSLLEWYSQAHGGEADAITRGFVGLVAGGMLGIGNGKVVPFRMEHVPQWAVLRRVIYEGHHDENILDLSRTLSPESLDGSVERAVRELVWVGVLHIEKGKVVPGRFGLAGRSDA